MGLKQPLDRTAILRLALEAQLDPRTVKRALEHGIESIKGSFGQKRLREAAERLGLVIE